MTSGQWRVIMWVVALLTMGLLGWATSVKSAVWPIAVSAGISCALVVTWAERNGSR